VYEAFRTQEVAGRKKTAVFVRIADGLEFSHRRPRSWRRRIAIGVGFDRAPDEARPPALPFDVVATDSDPLPIIQRGRGSKAQDDRALVEPYPTRDFELFDARLTS